MGVHKIEVEWHDLIENPNDVPVTDDPVYVIVVHHDSQYVDTINFRCTNGCWEIAVMPTEDDPYPEDYEPISGYPGMKVIAWCKPLLPSY